MKLFKIPSLRTLDDAWTYFVIGVALLAAGISALFTIGLILWLLWPFIPYFGSAAVSIGLITFVIAGIIEASRQRKNNKSDAT